MRPRGLELESVRRSCLRPYFLSDLHRDSRAYARDVRLEADRRSVMAKGQAKKKHQHSSAAIERGSVGDGVSKAGWSWRCVSLLILAGNDLDCRCTWDGKRFIVRADYKVTALLELEAAIHQFAADAML
jgi:hypothetical protein